MARNVKIYELVAWRIDKFLQEIFKVINMYFVELFDSVEKLQEIVAKLSKSNYADEREWIMWAINALSQNTKSITVDEEIKSLQKDITSMKKTINSLETKVLAKTKKWQK